MANAIKVNSADWEMLSNADKVKLTGILKKSGLLRDATIVPDASVKSVLKTGAATDSLAAQDSIFCKLGCDVAEAAAVAACASFTGPAAAVCVAAAHAGGEFCRSKC